MAEKRVADLRIGGLELWVHQREFPDAEDYWDGNWLKVTAICTAPGARVEVTGPKIRLPELAEFGAACQRVYENLHGVATLDCIEPFIRVQVAARDSQGHIEVTVEITPDHLTQQHRFTFELDQSYLPAVIEASRQALERFPIRGKNM